MANNEIKTLKTKFQSILFHIYGAIKILIKTYFEQKKNEIDFGYFTSKVVSFVS